MDDRLDQTYLQLYLRESQSAALLDVDHLPDVSEIDKQAWLKWIASKRDFAHLEMVGQIWLKAYPFGDMTEIHFHSDGTLDEIELFSRRKVKGQWQVVDGLLCLEVFRNNSKYQSKIVGNNDSTIHSSIEYKDHSIYSYHKLIQVMIENRLH